MQKSLLIVFAIIPAIGCIIPDTRPQYIRDFDNVRHTVAANRPAPGQSLDRRQLHAIEAVWHGGLRIQHRTGGLFAADLKPSEAADYCSMNLDVTEWLQRTYASSPERLAVFEVEAYLRFHDEQYDPCKQWDGTRWNAAIGDLKKTSHAKVVKTRSAWPLYAHHPRLLMLDGQLTRDKGGRPALTGMMKIGETTTVDTYTENRLANGEIELEPNITPRDVITQDPRQIVVLDAGADAGAALLAIDRMQWQRVAFCVVKPVGTSGISGWIAFASPAS